MSIYEPAIDPPDEPMACTWCDGYGAVSVASIHDVGGKVQVIAESHKRYIYNVEVECPRCAASGSEPAPEPDPDRQRDEARERDAI